MVHLIPLTGLPPAFLRSHTRFIQGSPRDPWEIKILSGVVGNGDS